MGENAPLLLIELGLVLGLTLLWGGWELHTLKRDKRKAEAEARARGAGEDDPSAG